MKESLQAGIEHEKRFRVPREKIVLALYPSSLEFWRMPEVFAAGFMVCLLEWTCVEVVNPYLDVLWAFGFGRRRSSGRQCRKHRQRTGLGRPGLGPLSRSGKAVDTGATSYRPFQGRS
jgi:hypothetical protein